MKQSLVNQDWNLLHSSVHKMIPSFSIVGIDKSFEEMAKKIQAYATSSAQTDTIHDMVLTLDEVCTQACKELKEEYTKLKNSK